LLTLEVTDFEDASARFSSSTLQLRAVNFNKALLAEILPEEIANACLELEDGLVGGCLYAH
jgi:hypothetical protein